MFLRRPRPPLPRTSRGQGPNPQPSPLSKPVVSQAADPPLGRGVLRVLRTARATKPTAGRAPQNWGSRGGARPGSRSSPRATAESQRERARRAATRNGRTAQRARYRAEKKNTLLRARLCAHSCAAPTQTSGSPLPHPRGGGTRAEGRSPYRSRPEVAWAQRQRPARPRPPLCGVGLLPQTHSLAAFPPSPEPSPGDVTAAAASALPSGPASPPGASVLPPLLQDRQDFLLTAPWAPSYIQPSRPMGAECLSRESRSAGSRESCRSDLKGTLRT